MFANFLEHRAVQKGVIATDYGYNKVQMLMNLANQKDSSVEFKSDTKVKVALLGNTTISNMVVGASVVSGTNLVVTLINPNKESIRVKDIVKDKNLVQGRVVATSTNTVTLAPMNGITWNAATHFTDGSSIAVIFDASGNGRSYGKTSLSTVPEYDYALLGKSRDTYDQTIIDRQETDIMYFGKYWYASQQMFLTKRFSRLNETRLVFSERYEHDSSDVEGGYNTTGGIRWSAKNNGGTFMQYSTPTLTEDDVQDFLKEMIGKQADAKRKIMFFVGKDALFAIQNFLKNNIIYSGELNSFGGKEVKGYSIFKYSIGGTEVDIMEYPLFNDIKMFPDLSTITGRPKMQGTVMAIDWMPAESANGTASIPTIQKYCYEGVPEILYKIVPGMLPGFENLEKEIASVNGFGLATSDVDAAALQIEEFSGYYIQGAKVGWMELSA